MTYARLFILLAIYFAIAAIGAKGKDRLTCVVMAAFCTWAAFDEMRPRK